MTDLVADRARVLCVQRTGWGKSAVYFLATALLREQGAGPTLIVSPLLALMRNQIEAAERLGHPRAHDQLDQPRRVGRGARSCSNDDAVDLLLISPERLNNPQFRRHDAAAVRRAGRPAGGRRGALHLRLGPRLPARLPAHPGDARAAARGRRRAVHDRDGERPRGGGRRRAARSSATPARCAPTAARWAATRCASRSSSCPRPADRLAWLATHLPELPGSGIVYTLTKRDADTVAEFLTGHGIPAEAYSGEVDTRAARRGRGAAAAQRAQGRRGHQRAGDGLRQARPRLRRALPGARQRDLLLPAGRPRRPRDRARRRRAAARRARTAGSRTSSSSRRSRRRTASSACSRRSTTRARRRTS